MLKRKEVETTRRGKNNKAYIHMLNCIAGVIAVNKFGGMSFATMSKRTGISQQTLRNLAARKTRHPWGDTLFEVLSAFHLGNMFDVLDEYKEVTPTRRPKKAILRVVSTSKRRNIA